MKSKLGTIPVLVMAALACPYPKAIAQSCSSTVGANNAGDFSTTAYSGATFSWSNPGNAQTSDVSYATAGMSLGILSSAYSNYLVVKDFGFSIPSTATVCKIIVEVQRSVSGLGVGGYVSDQSIKLVQSGAPYGNDLADPATHWPSSDGTVTYGNALLGSAWGGSWLPADVNSSNFGVAISTQLNTGLVALAMQGKINQVRVTIVYDPNFLLGITLEKFSATQSPDGDGHLLSWTANASTATSTNFIIQRSANSHDWQDIATVPATAASSYRYTDHNPLDGINFYRLHMVSMDGRSVWSTISEVKKDDRTTIRCWPNPCVNTINIYSPQPVIKVLVKDIQGRILYMRQAVAPANNWELPAENLPPGLYFVQVGSQTLRVLKQKN